ncbi:unnamed protein product [Diamesa hyperborea]
MEDEFEMKILNDQSQSIKIANSIINMALSEKQDFRVTNWDVFSNIISIFFRLITVIFNVNLAIEYYTKEEFLYFKLTVCFILIPAIITVILSITIYLEDRKLEDSKPKRGFFNVFVFVVLFPYTLRFCQSLIYAVKSKRAEKHKDDERQKLYYKLMLQEEADVSLVRIFECFLDAAPHKILHLTIIISGSLIPTVSQSLTLFSAFTGFAWSLAAYSRCIRLAQPDKKQMSWAGTICQCIWHFSVTLSRVFSIALVASLFPQYTVIALAIHVLLMTLWIFIVDRSPFCSYTMFHSFAFSLILGCVFVFTYILPKDTKNTFRRYAFFYSICAIENALCLIIFICFSALSVVTISIFNVLCICSFIVGIGAMIVYYTYLHPNYLSRRELMTEL